MENCLQLLYQRDEQGGIWSVITNEHHHNHPPEECMQGHSIARRLRADQSSLVTNTTKSGAPPKAVLALAQATDSTFLACSRDISNLKTTKKKELLAGRTMIDAFFTSLDDLGHTYDIQLWCQ